MDVILRSNEFGAAPYPRETICYKGLEMQPYRHTCYLDGRRLALTQIEFAVLQVLLENRGRTVGAREIAERVWDDAVYISRSDALAVHVRHLREKLHDTAKPFSYIQTAWGKGYRME